MPALRRQALQIAETPDEVRLRAWVQLARTARVVERRLSVMLAQAGLTLPQFDVLATLRFGEGVTQQELAARLLVTKGNVCGLLDRLETLRLVARRADDQDARANRLHLTRGGRALIDRVLPEHDRFILGLFDGQSDEAVITLRTGLIALEMATPERKE